MTLNADNKFEMVLGNERGGVGLFKSVAIGSIGFEDFILDMDIYPNPAEDILTIDLSKSTLGTYENSRFTLLDITGKEILSSRINSAKTNIMCDDFSRGIYILNVYLNHDTVTEKIVLK